MTPEREVQRFVQTGEHDELHRQWPGDDMLVRARTADAALRNALIQEVRQRTADCTPPVLPLGFDASRFVLGKVGPMVRSLFPARERQVLLDLFEQSLTFVTHANIEQILMETPYLSTAWTIANLYLGSLGLPGLDGQPVGLVGYSEGTTLYVSPAYFEDSDPFADWVVHEAAHVFHNWKRDRAGLPHTRTREFLLEIAYDKREVFAYACEAYARIFKRPTSPADRRSLHAEYAANWVPVCDGVDRAELVDVLAEAVKARNGWKRILDRCSPPRRTPPATPTAKRLYEPKSLQIPATHAGIRPTSI
ncbi:MAG: hypothetical protein K8T26_11400 [Lentisphaerae bacterium]|nr:hypothetical protein [Lentisphaerota bacterium]